MIIGMNAHDAGRTASGYFAEKNDCTVRAYATATGKTYAEAHAELWLAGRKMRRGFRFIPFAQSKGWPELPRMRMEVRRFIETVAIQGSWIVLVRGHVFAVVDGVINDTHPQSNLNRHVLRAWRVK